MPDDTNDEAKNDARFLRKRGRSVLLAINSGIRTNNEMAEKLGVARGTVSGYVERLLGMHMVEKIEKKESLEYIEAEKKGRKTEGPSVMLRLTSRGEHVLDLFEKNDESVGEEQTSEFLRSGAIREEAKQQRTMELIDDAKALKAATKEGMDTEALLATILGEAISLNREKSFNWANTPSIKVLEDDELISTLNERSTSKWLRAVAEYLKAMRHNGKWTFDKRGKEQGLFKAVKKVLDKHIEDEIGLEANRTLVEFRAKDGGVPEEVMDAVLLASWHVYANDCGPPTAIAMAQADIELIESIREDLTPAQQKRFAQYDEYLTASTPEEFVKSMKSGRAPKQRRKIDETRRGDLRRYLAAKFSRASELPRTSP